ncbi:TetR/AcrR family transcriptional regulator [Streptomyces sp. cg2]|uniref:TetR/AcrR family transcriptional regulator n=1 Tax=Streptomyces sp. cg2 TaxID=3238799 RepID=UPI0034E2627F
MPRPLIPNRRESILDAAENLFIERGFEATTMQEVSERVGIAKGAIYREFVSKTQLVQEVLDRSADRLWNDVAQRVEAADARRLSEIYRLGMSALLAEPLMLAAYTNDRGTGVGAFVETGHAERYEERLRLLTAYLGELQRAGALRIDLDLDATATALASASIGLSYAGALLGQMSPARLLATAGIIADMIERGLETDVGSIAPEASTHLLKLLFANGPRGQGAH